MAFDKQAERANSYTKGLQVVVLGTITSREYVNRDGVKVKAWEVKVSQIQGDRPKDDAPKTDEPYDPFAEE